MSAPIDVFRLIGYYGTLYGLLMGVLILGYPLAQRYIAPWAAFIFPLNPNTSILKIALISTLMYWGMVGIAIWQRLKKNKPIP